MENKNPVQGVLSLFLLVVTVLLIYSVFWGPLKQIGPDYPARTVVVAASGSTVTKPDVAAISFAVVTEGTNTQQVVDDNNQKMNGIISYLKEQNVDEADIKTTGYNLSPVYTQRSSLTGAPFTPTISRYSLHQSVQVKIRDFSKISPILSQLVTLGANQMSNVSFTIDDPEQFMEEARAEALAKAREKAERMARDGGFTLGKVVSVSEYGGSPYPMYDKVSAVGMGGAEMSVTPPTIEPGSSEVEGTVNMVFEIR